MTVRSVHMRDTYGPPPDRPAIFKFTYVDETGAIADFAIPWEMIPDVADGMMKMWVNGYTHWNVVHGETRER